MPKSIYTELYTWQKSPLICSTWRDLMILLLDNYDSFTWNLWHFLSDLGAEVKTLRNDAASVDEVMAMGAEGIVLSPGPGTPAQAGITEGLVRVAAGRLPILGVCLGHQAIWTAFGGSLMRVDPPMHGKLSRLNHEGTGLFAGLRQDLGELDHGGHVLAIVGDVVVAEAASASEATGSRQKASRWG